MNKLKDPVSSLTHLIFAGLSIPVSVILITLSVMSGSTSKAVAMSIFGFGLFALYTASGVYHGLKVSEKTTLLLKKIDHMMIFVLIAGTYTPICLGPLKGVWGYSLLAIVWAMAIAGIFLKIFWIGAPRWLSTAIYVAMGWCVIIAFYPLVKQVPLLGVALLSLGGITYTLGALIYAFKWPPLKFKYFGFHEIFHLFVMGGTAFHVVFMFGYVL